jgi:hypothetical protein
MHGSFSSKSAETFLKMMAYAGYETREVQFDAALQNFSTGLMNGSRNGSAFEADLNEERGEYIENFDFTRCVRPDGSSYGSRGKCRLGIETAKPPEEGSRSRSSIEREIKETLEEIRGASGYQLIPLRGRLSELKLERREAKKGEKSRLIDSDEQSAIDQLSQLLPKGENIMDSLGNITVSSGRTVR